MRTCKTLVPAVLAFEAALVSGYTSYLAYVPNADIVPWNGGYVVGLGHPTPIAETASTNNANEFGVEVRTAYQTYGKDPQAIWTAICNEDPDEDGLTNGEELCDPDCLNPGGYPVCENGFTLSHPAIHNNETFVYKHDPAFVAHGIIMTLAWLVLAPYAIIRTALYKKRPPPSLPPRWLLEHQYIFCAVIALSYVGFFVLLPQYGTELIDAAFEDVGKQEARDHRAELHAVVGIFVLILGTLNPLSGYFRAKLPKPGQLKSKIRMAWEIQHQWTGRSVFVLAMWASVTGYPIAFPEHGKYVSRVLVGIVATLAGFTCIYVLHFRDTHVQMIKAAAEDQKDKKGDSEEEAGRQVEKSYSQQVPDARSSSRFSSLRNKLDEFRKSLRGSREPIEEVNDGDIAQATL